MLHLRHTLFAYLFSALFLVEGVSASEWQNEFQKAQKSLELKSYAESENILKKALASKEISAFDSRRIQANILLIKIYYAQNKLPQAASTFATLIPILKQAYGAHDRDYAQTLRNYADLQEKLGKVEEARKLKEEAESIENPAMTLGYINTKGQLSIRWQLKCFHFLNAYMLPGPFSEGMAAIYNGDPRGKIVYINREGQQIIQAKWQRGMPFQKGSAQVYDLSGVALIDKTGNVLIPLRHDYYPTQRREGLWADSGGSVYRDDSGRCAVTVQGHSLRPFHEGLAGVTFTDAKDKYSPCGFIDRTGKVVIAPRFIEVKDFYQGLAPVREWGESDSKIRKEWGYIDKSGRKVIEARYDFADRFSEGLACIGTRSENGWTMDYRYISSSGRGVVPGKYDWAEPFAGGLALVHQIGTQDRYGHVFRNGKAGFIDKSGRWVFIDRTGQVVLKAPEQAEEVYSFSDGLARVKVAGRYGFMDRQGNLVVKAKYIWADDYSEGLAAVISSW